VNPKIKKAIIAAEKRNAQRKKKRRPKPKKIKLTPIEKTGKKFAKELARKATPSEKQFKRKLLSINISFSFQKPFSNNKKLYIADFFIPSFSLIIELDGGYHNTEEQMQYDEDRDIWFKRHGFNVWRMTNEKSRKITKDEILAQLGKYKRTKMKNDIT